MRFAYRDLGRQPAAATVTVRLSGSAANVLLLDDRNFAWYRSRQPFRYIGGQFFRSPVELEVPHDGHWYVVVDLGGFRGRTRATVDVRPPDRSDRNEQAVHAGTA